MGRSRRSQSQHDTKVQRLANKLSRQGFEVQADIPGFTPPKTISGYRPDVVGKKGIQRKIIEVETPDSLKSKRDLEQQKAFRQAAKRSDNTTFVRVVADD
jgi:hypothetical protein